MASKNKICRCGKVVPSGSCPCAETARKARLTKNDAKRPSAAKRGYDAAWTAVRRQYLASHPWCSHEGCDQRATDVDHIVPIRDAPDLRLRWSNLRGFCHAHHSSRTLGEQVRPEYLERARPSNLLRSRIPVTLVCGPPGSGKTTYVSEQAGVDDLVIDLDVIKAELHGGQMYDIDNPALSRAALDRRNDILRSLATDRRHKRCWFIVSAPTKSERHWWRDMLGCERIVVMDVDADECKRRIMRDIRRIGHRDRFIALVDQWFERANVVGS